VALPALIAQASNVIQSAARPNSAFTLSTMRLKASRGFIVTSILVPARPQRRG
jgi:hypothetical protein